ncbi:uncharacterized protein [Aegilops tauschii subsp. strangulata]|uniref:uncharacterized protein n=1 Tax=Aegilops tauschii subsp. strangulata TaxID=200361 RepID=UPI003CC8878C
MPSRYDVALWRLGLACSRLNSPKIESRANAELVGSSMIIESSPSKLASRIVVEEQDNIRESGEEAMAAFARAHLEYVQVEMEFYWKTDVEQSKRKNDSEAGPSSSETKKKKNA